MESASRSSSSQTLSTGFANSTLTTTSIPLTANTTQILPSGMASSSPPTLTDTLSTTSTTKTTSSMSTTSSTTSTTTSSSSPTTSTSSKTTSSTPTISPTIVTTTTTTSSFSSPTTTSATTTAATTTTTTTSPSPPIIFSKSTTSTDNNVLTPTTDAPISHAPSAPSVITTVLISTGSNGSVVTITQVQINPTLSPNNKGNSENSTFFSNTGAVAGTFILVGLTAASILLWILFYVRRRRRRRQLEHESAVSATLAAAGLYRTPLDDDDPRDDAKQSPYGTSPAIDMNQRSSSRLGIATVHSQPSNGRMSAHYDSSDHEGELHNSYAELGVSRQDGYMPARTSSPDAHYSRDRQGSTSTGGFVKGHSANHSAGSYEPLLASYNRRPSNPSLPSPTIPPQPLASVAGQNAAAEPSTGNPQESTDIQNSKDTDDRLDPNIRQRLEGGGDNASARELRDEEDYSRPVLQVRNLPDTSSRES